MNKEITLLLIIFSILWMIIILRCVRKEQISIRYSLIWLFMALLILIVGLFPSFVITVAESIGFLTISNLIIGIILTLLMFITLALTMIVTKQREQIKTLIQEVSTLKK